jgi:hypothetical protein
MAVTWTTAAIVKTRFGMVSIGSLSDGTIEEFINECEYDWTMRMETYGHFGIGGGTFTAGKQGILRRLATSYAVLCCVTAYSASFNTLSDIEPILNWAMTEYLECSDALDKRKNHALVDELLENE